MQTLRNGTIWVAMVAGGMWAGAQERQAPADGSLTPPAVPLVACDPYFSVWSPGDALNGVETTHWTGRAHPLSSLVRVDGEVFRLMGTRPSTVPPMEQRGLEVMPTQTIYRFAGAGVEVEMTFTTPALPEDLDLLSRPVTYVGYEVRSTDGKEHQVSLYLGASAELTVNEPDQEVAWQDASASGLATLQVGSQEQAVLNRAGDDLRIDWGYLYLSAPGAEVEAKAVGRVDEMGYAFAAKGLADASGVKGKAERADGVGIGLQFKPFLVGAQAQERWAMLAYDDLYAIQYNHQNLRPYWRKNGWEAQDLLEASAKEREALLKRCEAFDRELMADLKELGGEKYARICALAYRQCFAAGKFVADANGQPLQFCKENHSNGCIATSDVFYPMAPQFLLFGPTLAKSFLVPFLEYARSERWKFPFAPHDLGTYPLANGQVYGGGEKTEENQMPVEESGNLLLLMAAVAQMEGNADFAEPYWGRLVQWAEYLKKEGFDPPNQLCTDDFAGHMAHNVNLSVKAICGLGAFAKLCEIKGEKALAAEYGRVAKEFAKRWVEEAKDGDHYRLAFDRPGTWSQKYNLVWDRILGLNLFPEEVKRTEMDFYLKKQGRYGLPLDNRAGYTKLDWILWTATLTQDRKDFEALVDPVYRFLNEGPSRSPMTDWYETGDGRKVGFTARPVVGGVFLQAMYLPEVWSKWAKRDVTKAKGWAPMPDYVPPVLVPVVKHGGDAEGVEWLYTTKRPEGAWESVGYRAEGWSRGAAGFGAGDPPRARIRTNWQGSDIWLRREFELPASLPENLALAVYHDEDAEVYLNGERVAKLSGFATDYRVLPLSPETRSKLKAGKNVVAVHCHQRTGGQFIDLGFVEVRPGEKK